MLKLLKRNRQHRGAVAPHRFLSLFLIFVTVLGSLVVFMQLSTPAKAAATGYLRLDRVKANTATGGFVCINPNANQTTVRQLAISFADGSGTGGAASFTVNSTAANWTWDVLNLPTGTSAFPGTATTSTVATGTVTFIVTADQSLNTGTTYCLHFTGTSTLTTPTAAANSLNGTITLKNSGGSQIGSETFNYAASVISEDQVTVTATVPPLFTLSLSGTSIAHGTLTAGTVDNGSITATMGTNATNGWIAWVKAGAAQLTSAASGGAITSPGSIDDATSDLTGGTYGWVLDIIPTQDADGDGTITQAAGYGQEYDGGNTCGTSTTGGTLSTTYQAIASSDGTSDNEQLELCSLVRVAAYQEAATDYTQTVTFTAAGRF
jgi:hypothetical protein